MKNKWLVEIKKDVFDEVIAYAFTIEAGGTLAFVNMRGDFTEARAAGTWLSVVKGVD